MESANIKPSGTGFILSPDPSTLTTQQLLREVNNLKELYDQKFSYVHDRFEQVELHRVEQKVDTKTAVDAALQAQKEAAGKAETVTTTVFASVQLTLDDVKSRLGAIEGNKAGTVEAQGGRNVEMGLLIAALTLLVSLGIGVIALVMK